MPDSAQRRERAPPEKMEQYAEPPAAADDTAGQLKELADLKAQGILSDAEFSAAKAKILT